MAVEIGMSRGRFWLVNCLLFFFIGGHAINAILDTEYWPFSSYPMFSYLSKGGAARRYRLIGVQENGVETFIHDDRFLTPLAEKNVVFAMPFLLGDRGPAHRMRDPRYTPSSFNPEDGARRLQAALDQIRRRYESRRIEGLIAGPSFRSIRFYRYEWNRLDLSNVLSPDRRALLAESVR